IVSGPTTLVTPRGATRIDVTTAREMHAAVMARVASADIFIGVAAVADYHVVNEADHKLKKERGMPVIHLAENPDILAEVARLKPAPFCVGFAAETEHLRQYAQAKRRKKGIPLLAANLAQDAFGRDDNALTLFDHAGEHQLPRAPKAQIARQLVAHIVNLLERR
ncbi:MAG: phosphopantothenoylcysteine decarboxylase, partial [Burkholderiales bacterium]